MKRKIGFRNPQSNHLYPSATPGGNNYAFNTKAISSDIALSFFSKDAFSKPTRTLELDIVSFTQPQIEDNILFTEYGISYSLMNRDRLAGVDLKSGINGWVDDNSINLYLKMLACESNLARSANDEIHINSSFLYDKILREGDITECILEYNSKSNEINFKRHSTSFFPINMTNTHWLLISADLKKKSITLIDNFYAQKPNEFGKKSLENIRNYLTSKAKSLNEYDFSDPSSWSLIVEKNIPRQTNYFDCGIYLMYNAFLITHNMGLNTFTQSDMKQIRKQLVVDIVLNRSISSLDKSIIPRFKIPRFKTSDLIHISNQKNYKVINPKLMEELKLQANIVSWREIGGDGHCYYRAVFISIFEKILFNKSYKIEFPKIILALRNAPLEYISFPSKVSTPKGKVFIQKHFKLIKCLEDILSDNVEVPAAHDLHSWIEEWDKSLVIASKAIVANFIFTNRLLPVSEDFVLPWNEILTEGCKVLSDDEVTNYLERMILRKIVVFPMLRVPLWIFISYLNV